jgi:hypothetical protein
MKLLNLFRKKKKPKGTYAQDTGANLQAAKGHIETARIQSGGVEVHKWSEDANPVAWENQWESYGTQTFDPLWMRKKPKDPPNKKNRNLIKSLEEHRNRHPYFPNGWIKNGENKPELGKWVLITRRGEMVVAKLMITDTNEFMWSIQRSPGSTPYAEHDQQITAWMCLPEPFKE